MAAAVSMLPRSNRPRAQHLLPDLPALGPKASQIESRPPEKSDDKPAFPQQTRAPYHASPPFKITTLIDTLPAPWSLAFLPDGKIILTERLPGSLPDSRRPKAAKWSSFGARGRRCRPEVARR